MKISICRKSGIRGKKEGGFVLIYFLLLILVLLMGVGSFYAFGFADLRASTRTGWMSQALYVAEAGVDRKLSELVTGSTANVIGTLDFDALGTYQGAYDVFYGEVGPCQNQTGSCAINPDTGAERRVTQYATGDNVIFSTGTISQNGVQLAQKIVRMTVRRDPLFDPDGAVSINGVSSTAGSITVDGREHDRNGNLTGGAGTFGISTSGSRFSQGGSSKIGGNGLAPARPAPPGTIQLNAPLLPNTPEALLGLSAGALDRFKTDTPPTAPFNGVVYLTRSWTSANLDRSSGILIVHDAEGDAELKNVSGTFKGVIISDDIEHINSNAKLIGALFGLKSEGVTLGNGNAQVLFSPQILAGLPLANYKVTSWEDSQND